MHLVLSGSDKSQSNVPSTQEINSKATEFRSNVPNAAESNTANLPSQSPSNIDNGDDAADMAQVAPEAPETETAAAQPKRSSSGLCCQQVIK